MTTLRHLICLLVVVLLVCSETRLQGQTSNLPPQVSIVWPRGNCSSDDYVFTPGTIIKVKATAGDSDGSVAQVQFFADTFNQPQAATNLIGVATNPPYCAFWKTGPSLSSALLTAVAVDNLGATAESSSVWITVISGATTYPIFEITSPPNRDVVAAPGSFIFSAELLASPHGDTGSVEFSVGTNSVGAVTQLGSFTNTTPTYSLTATNIPEGNFMLRVWKDRFSTLSFATGSCQPPVIHVTKLGMNASRLTPGGKFEFDVVTSFPTNQNVVEASSNLLNWFPISTNVPFANTFSFTDPSPTTNAPRFYRAVVPAQ